MSRSNNKAPLLDRTLTVSPSPARDSLKGSLDVASTDAGLSLKKKKSWFGSLRDAVQKGALQAKATVDSFRGDQHKAEAYLLLMSCLTVTTR